MPAKLIDFASRSEDDGRMRLLGHLGQFFKRLWRLGVLHHLLMVLMFYVAMVYGLAFGRGDHLWRAFETSFFPTILIYLSGVFGGHVLLHNICEDFESESYILEYFKRDFRLMGRIFPMPSKMVMTEDGSIVICCNKCEKRNRLHLGFKNAICGSCKTPLVRGPKNPDMPHSGSRAEQSTHVN